MFLINNIVKFAGVPIEIFSFSSCGSILKGIIRKLKYIEKNIKINKNIKFKILIVSASGILSLFWHILSPACAICEIKGRYISLATHITKMQT